MLVLVPANYSKWLWGWPNTFVKRMRSAGSAVFALGAYSGDSSGGIDTLNDLDLLPKNYEGGIWTNEIELIGKAFRDRHKRNP